jgi:hypothetical protein
MKQINFSWGRAPLSIFMLFLLGLSPAFSQQLIITSPDRDPNTPGHQQCENNDVNLAVTGLGIGQTVAGYFYSDDNGASWTNFGNLTNATTDNDQPIADGRRYRVSIFEATLAFPFVNFFFLPGGNFGAGANGTGPSPVEVDIMPSITNPAIVAPMMVCQDAPNITLTASANNDIDPPGPRFTIASTVPGSDACQGAGSLTPTTGLFDLNEGFWGTVTVRARFQGCDANGLFRANTSANAPTASATITVKRTFEAIENCVLFPTPTILTGPTSVCEGQTEKYTAFNPYAFPSPAGHTYEFALDNPGAGVIATPNTASMTNITWTNNYTGGLIPVQIAASAWGCKNPAGGGNGFADWNATGVLPVFICNRPILKTLIADKTTTCEGECINFYVMFDFVNGSKGPFIVNYTVNGIPQQTLIPANSNNALLTSVCGTASYSVVITSVQNNNILELFPNGDGTFTSKFNNCTQTAPLPAAVNITVIPNPKVLTLTGTPDEDLIAPGVQKCEGGSITLTATAAGSNLLYTWTKNGAPVQGPSASNTLTFPATLANPANLSEITVYTVIVEGKCDDPDSKTILVTIYKQPVGGTIAPALTKVCGAVPVSLNLTGQIGTVRKWQRQVNCAGAWIDIPATAGLTTYAFTTVPNTITCYRAVVGNGTCPDVFSTTARVEADAPAVGGIVTLANNMSMTMTSICPNQNAVLKVSGYTGKILNWQSNSIISPVWVNIPGTANNINLTVNGSSIATTTFFRVCICSPLGICTGPDALAYSASFKVSKKSICAPPAPPPAALTQNTSVPGNGAVISKAFPIPTNHRVTLDIEGASEGDAQIEVMDLMGKVAIRETRFLQFGNNEVSFDISNLSNGIYIVKFVDSEKHQSSIKITKSN